MISVAAAKELIKDSCSTLEPVVVSLEQAIGKTLASDLYAPIDIPSFPQAGMDGYAFLFEGWKPGLAMPVIGEIAAGRHEKIDLPGGMAMRIFTGAPVPEGADTVVMQEKTNRQENQVYIDAPDLKPGDNVRLPGSEIRKGSLALPAGTLLTPAAIGFLAGMGIRSVEIFPAPRIALLITGNELQEPGLPLAYGQVYESNSIALKAALQTLGLEAATESRVPDTLEILTAALSDALEKHDLVLITGGISVGDYDYTLAATEACAVTPLFHKVQQRPGKPLYAGKKGNTLVMGLPGNPSSVLTCFYEYVTIAVSGMMQKELIPTIKTATVSGDYKKPAALTVFLKGYYSDGQVAILPSQESYKLNSFAVANCLVVLPAETSVIRTGEQVEIHLLT
jgi:molybdopterin molybdotransferase